MTKILLAFGIIWVFGGATPSEAQINVGTNIDTAVDVSTVSTTAIGTTDTSGSIDGSIKVEREDVEEDGEVILISSDSVNNSSDLELYARSILLSDSNVEEIDFEEDDVKFKYKQKGKVLGLFSVEYDIDVEVNNDGEIEVRYPWYAAFTKNSNKVAVRERMETDVRDLLDRNSNASGEIEMNARVMAQIASLIHTILIEELNVDISANVNTATSTGTNSVLESNTSVDGAATDDSQDDSTGDQYN